MNVMDLIIHHLKAQHEKGLKTYGVTIDDCNYDSYDMNIEAILELVDCVQYLAKENIELKKRLEKWEK